MKSVEALLTPEGVVNSLRMLGAQNTVNVLPTEGGNVLHISPRLSPRRTSDLLVSFVQGKSGKP